MVGAMRAWLCARHNKPVVSIGGIHGSRLRLLDESRKDVLYYLMADFLGVWIVLSDAGDNIVTVIRRFRARPSAVSLDVTG